MSLFDENQEYIEYDDENAEGQTTAPKAIEPPLAVRMRPRTLEDVYGQDAVIGKGTWLRSAIENGKLSPIILYGPPGVGKTTLAKVIATVGGYNFREVSAISGGISDLRDAIAKAAADLREGTRTILFVDEIHRFNKSQQDALLHAVEDRTVILVGATTENPYFEVNTALLSRMRIVELKPLDRESLIKLINKGITDERGLAGKFKVSDEAIELIADFAGGDARSALTTLELAADIASAADPENPVIGIESVKEAAVATNVSYDKDGDAHYDIISAFIKSMRGSDPDAAVYWLARMVNGGEDPKFIARRIFILAAEDIGLADPNALSVAAAAFKAAEVLGYPECRIPLAEAAVYMALAPKSNSAYLAIDAALEHVRTMPAGAVPSNLRDRHRPGSASYGEYLYPHSRHNHYVDQRYLPEGIEEGAFYDAGVIGWEMEANRAFNRRRHGDPA